MHRMGAVPKMDGTTQLGVRVIQNYTYPKLGSMNDFVRYFPVKLSKMEEVADYVERNQGCFIANIDLSNYFRHPPIDPRDWPLLVGGGSLSMVGNRSSTRVRVSRCGIPHKCAAGSLQLSCLKLFEECGRRALSWGCTPSSRMWWITA